MTTPGFAVPRTVFGLTFADEQYAGLVVKVRALSLQEALDGFDMQWAADNDTDFATRKAKLDELHHHLVDHLVEWNLQEEDGTPVPPTFEGLRSLEPPFTAVLVTAWLRGRTAVSAPLEQPSDGGAPSELEASIPMENLSESLAS